MDPKHREKEPKRARRRRKTLSVSAHRRAEHLSRIHGGEQVDCVCELASMYFAKRRALGCDCRKRKRGAPRIAVGMCCLGKRERIYTARREARELLTAARAGLAVGEAPTDRVWHAGGRPRGAFAIEVRDLWKGAPGPWSEHRRYRTEAGRDAALRCLSKRDAGKREYRALALG